MVKQRRHVSGAVSILLPTGPELWGLVSQTCNGRSQSPVNIVTRKVLPDERLTPFHFTGYKETFYGSLINNGHSGMS